MVEQASCHEEPGRNGIDLDVSAANLSLTVPARNDDENWVSQSPRTPSLQICTDVPTSHLAAANNHELGLHRSVSATGFPRRVPSVRTALAAVHSSAGSLSPGSAFSSPQLAAITDITPLPSPINFAISPWINRGSSHSLSRTSSVASHQEANLQPAPRPSSARHNQPALDIPPPRSELTAPKQGHSRNRSLSEYVPPAPHVPIRQAAVGHGKPKVASRSRERGADGRLHRERYLAEKRGIAPTHILPTKIGRADVSDSDNEEPILITRPRKKPVVTYDVQSIRTQQPRRYRKIRELGQGTFSQVVLAVREEIPGRYTGPPRHVAVKVVEYGPAGGADQERVEVSLKREVEILKSLNHPSVVQLKAFGGDEKSALLVLDYCPGGDLFEFASEGLGSFGPALVRRIFAELVGAVRYLHQNLIVHRDIKLENVLVNLHPTEMNLVPDWHTYNRAVITLTDLGLSRRIPEPPASPLLHTRCGSEDYAAPEILMGQPYDGRSTDAWAMAVLLYAIMESRLPFDVLPGTRGDPRQLRARTPHRIARCEWSWYKYADEDGEWDPAKGKHFDGAQDIVKGLLVRATRRMTLDEVAQTEWVKEAIAVPALQRGDKEIP